MMDELEYQRRLRNGTLPVIITDIRKPKRRMWVNSEKFPFFALDGFRVLHNGTIFERKKSWWIFVKWTPKYDKSDYDEVYVLDEAVIR